MNINLEAAEKHAVQSYSDNKVQINSLVYENSLIVSKEEIITDLTINDIQNMDSAYLELFLGFEPELIIIGHENSGKFPPMEIISELSKRRIGFECMSIGAACRTFNVLLGEHRTVVAGLIFK